MVSERVRELAREEPEAFERVARARDDRLQDKLLQILEEERGAST